jgi:hypothetical protein
MVDRQERVDLRLAIDDEVLALITQVRAARRHVLLTVTAPGVRQERFKPGADEWSIANVVEHLVLAEQAGIHRLWQAAAGLQCGQEVWSGTMLHRRLSIEDIKACPGFPTDGPEGVHPSRMG